MINCCMKNQVRFCRGNQKYNLQQKSSGISSKSVFIQKRMENSLGTKQKPTI